MQFLLSKVSNMIEGAAKSQLQHNLRINVFAAKPIDTQKLDKFLAQKIGPRHMYCYPWSLSPVFASVGK